MRFRVRVRDSAGLTRTDSREADSRTALMDALRAERLLVIGVETVSDSDGLPGPWHWSWLKPMTTFDIEMGLRQLAAMLRSGVTLVSALSTVEEQSASPRARRTWRRVRESIVHGHSFAEALSGEKGRFPEIVIRLGEVGERSGELEYAITRAADQLEARRNLRSSVVNALVYPIIAVLMAIGVSAYLVIAVIPKVAEFLVSGGAALPAMTQLLVDVADWVNGHGITILIAVGGILGGWALLRLLRGGREMEDAFLLRLPVTGRILRLAGTALFARSMQMMTESGMTLLDSLTTGARLMSNRRFRRRIETAHEIVLRGGTLADSLSPAVEFTPMLRRMSAVGEVTGTLPEIFGETARFHEMLLALAVKRFGLLIEPVTICITGGIVGFVYVAFFMALFAMAGTN